MCQVSSVWWPVADKIAYLLGDTWDAIRVLLSVLRQTHTLLGESETLRFLPIVKELYERLGSGYEERLANIVSAVVTESLEVGEVSFSTCSEATILSNLREALFAGLYAYTDLPADVERLHRVLSKLIESDIKANPYLLFAMLTDDELYFLDYWSEERPIAQGDIDRLQVGEFRLPGREDFSFLASCFVRGST